MSLQHSRLSFIVQPWTVYVPLLSPRVPPVKWAMRVVISRWHLCSFLLFFKIRPKGNMTSPGSLARAPPSGSLLSVCLLLAPPSAAAQGNREVAWSHEGVVYLGRLSLCGVCVRGSIAHPLFRRPCAFQYLLRLCGQPCQPGPAGRNGPGSPVIICWVLGEKEGAT